MGFRRLGINEVPVVNVYLLALTSVSDNSIFISMEIPSYLPW